MISESAVYATAAAVYAAATVACVWRLRRVPAGQQRFLRLATLTVAVGGAASALLALDAGSVTVNGYAVAVPTVVSNLVAYPVLWAIAAMLADADRRLVAFAAAVPFVQVAAFWVAPIYGGVVALASLAVVVGSYLVLAVVFVRSVWAATTGLSEHRRLLHWKARNLLLFLIGMFIVFSFLSVAGAFSDTGTVVLNQYVSVLIRVGFAAFLFANVDALGETTAGSATNHSGRAATGGD